MKIIQVLNQFLPFQAAGTEVYTWALSKQIQMNGIEVSVLIPNYGKNTDEEYEYDGLLIHKYAEPSLVDRSLIMGFRKPDGLNNFLRYIKYLKPDIVHFHELAGSNGITLHHIKAVKEIGFKVVITFHLVGYTCMKGTLMRHKKLCDGIISISRCSICCIESKGHNYLSPVLAPLSLMLQKLNIDTTRLNNKFGTALGIASLVYKLKNNLNLIFQYSDAIVTLSKYYQNILLSNGLPNDKIHYIPQALPHDPTGKTETDNLKRSPTLRVMFIGRISPIKGLDLLINAVKGINPDKISLSIYGQSVDEAYELLCKKLIQGQDNIYWGGKLLQEQVISTMKEHDLLCLSSAVSEMSPLVIQEAFAAGIPVLASNVYGNAEQVLHDWNGLLFTFNSVTSLQVQLRRCIEDANLLNQLKKNISTPRSFKEVASDYDLLYKKICSWKT